MTGATAYFSKQLAQVVMPTQAGAFVKIFGDAQAGAVGGATIAKNGLLSGLFAMNGAYVISTLDTPSKDNRMNADTAAFGLFYTGLSATSMVDTLAPDLKASIFGTTDKGAAATPQRQLLETLLQKFDSWDTTDLTKTMLKNSARTLLSATPDVMSFIVADGGLIPLFADPTTNPGHEFAYALAGVSDLGPAIAQQIIKNAAEQAVENAAKGGLESAGKQLLWGMSEDGWTGVGVAGNILAATVQYFANQYDVAHMGDKGVTAYLLALGVKPEVAEPFARHATTATSGESAGPALTAYFGSTSKMVDWMNRIPNGHVADVIATHFKQIEPGKDKDGHYVLGKDQVADIQTFLNLNQVPLG